MEIVVFIDETIPTAANPELQILAGTSFYATDPDVWPG